MCMHERRTQESTRTEFEDALFLQDPVVMESCMSGCLRLGILTVWVARTPRGSFGMTKEKRNERQRG